jgi:hypothetical protein
VVRWYCNFFIDVSGYKNFYMILYTEKQLEKAYQEYNKIRINAGLPMVSFDNYRTIFERNMEREYFE